MKGRWLDISYYEAGLDRPMPSTPGERFINQKARDRFQLAVEELNASTAKACRAKGIKP